MLFKKLGEYRRKNIIAFLSIIFLVLLAFSCIVLTTTIYYINHDIKPDAILSLYINLFIFLATLFTAITAITAICLYDHWKLQHNHKIISRTALEALQNYDELLLKIYPVMKNLSSNPFEFSDDEFANINNYINLNLEDINFYALKLDLKLTQLEFISDAQYPESYYLTLDHLKKSDSTIDKWKNTVDVLCKIANDEEKFKEFIKQYIHIK